MRKKFFKTGINNFSDMTLHLLKRIFLQRVFLSYENIPNTQVEYIRNRNSIRQYYSGLFTNGGKQ